MSTAKRARRQQESAALIRKGGLRAFVLRRGVIGFGVPFGLLMTAFMYFSVAGARLPTGREDLKELGLLLTVLLPMGLVAGALWAGTMWLYFEWRNWFDSPAVESDSPPTV